MEWFIAIVVIAALGVAALVAVGGLGQMSTDPVRDVYRQDLPPAGQPLQASDVSALRFGVTLRGYSMGQVDDVLDRLTKEIADRDAALAERDAMIAELSGTAVTPTVADPNLDQGHWAPPSPEQPLPAPPGAIPPGGIPTGAIQPGAIQPVPQLGDSQR